MAMDEAPSVFLQALRQAGIPVDVQEVERLYRIFALQPAMDRQQLYDVLRCLLIKTPQHQDDFETLFAQWCPDIRHVETAVSPENAAVRAEPEAPDAEDVPLPPRRTAPPSSLDDHRSHDADRAGPPAPAPSAWRTVWRTWRQRLLWIVGVAVAVGLLAGVTLVAPAAARTTTWPRLGLGVMAGLCAWWAWQRYRHSALPQALVKPTDAVLWQPLPDVNLHGPVLLDAPHMRRLAWRIGRFVSDDYTPHLDLPRTVNVTARAGGQVTLHYQHAIYPREVWLWLDEATADDTMWRLADEVQHTLTRAGLPCRRGVFWEVPLHLTWAEGQRFTPLSMDGRRQHALVVVCSDGGGLTKAYDLATTHHALAQLLHALATWPHLAFVDMGGGAYNVATLLQGYGLRCLAPQDVPAFLGAQDVPMGQVAPQPVVGALKIWAAGLALLAEPPDTDSAYALRQHLQHTLGLAVPAWGLAAILRQASDSGNSWPLQQRAAWLNWLRMVDSDPRAPHLGPRLEQVLTFWQQRYMAAEQAGQAPDSQGAYRLRVHRAVLDLWRAPQAATDALFAIHETGVKALQVLIRQQLYGLAPHDVPLPPEQPAIRLPWRWQDCPEQTQSRLVTMGFLRDAGLSAQDLRFPGALALLLGGCLGLGAMALWLSGWLGSGLLVLLAALAAWQGYKAQRRGLDGFLELLDMVELPGGTFAMGAAPDDGLARDDERPQHLVTLSGFAMSRMPVTRGLYRQIVPLSASSFWRHGWRIRDSRVPATHVNWFEAVSFCNALSHRSGLTPCYHIEKNTVRWERTADGYRLPTEAEWEYAARAGTTTRWFCGDEPDGLARYAWFGKNMAGRVHPVGTKAANPWGLHDMAGNVWEWCWDWQSAYSAEAVTDPSGPDNGVRRVVRGGAVWLEARDLRSSLRRRNEPEAQDDVVGFRVVRRPRRQP